MMDAPEGFQGRGHANIFFQLCQCLQTALEKTFLGFSAFLGSCVRSVTYQQHPVPPASYEPRLWQNLWCWGKTALCFCYFSLRKNIPRGQLSKQRPHIKINTNRIIKKQDLELIYSIPSPSGELILTVLKHFLKTFYFL